MVSPWPLTWSRASPAVGWGSSGWEDSLAFGMDNRNKKKNPQQTKKPVTGTQSEGRDMWAGDRQSMCVGKGQTESEQLELRDKNSHRVTVRTEVGGSYKTQLPPREWKVTDRDLWRNTQTEEWEIRGRGKGGTHRAPGLPPPAWTLWGSLRGPVCATPPQRSGRARAGLRGPRAPWPHTVLPECGRGGPSRPVARRGRGHRQPRCPSPGS